MLIIYQFFKIIHTVEKTNRELNRFFQSIRNDDFTQSFSSQKMGPTFDKLHQSFNEVTQQFLRLRSEKQEHFRYLQTVVKHVGVGLISFKANGDIELINKAARLLLKIDQPKNLISLEKSSKPLVKTLLRLKPEEKTSLKIMINQKLMYLSLRATEFKLHGELYKLVSLYNIQNEIEKEQISRELEIAWQVQKSLLPKENPRIPGYNIAGQCVPAKEVGGDYYDFIPIDESRLALIIGDVSGKGIPSAFYMTLTKGFIQSIIKEARTPRKILLRINDFMYRTIDKNSFMTMFIAILNKESGEISYARAGHNPAIYYQHARGKSKLLKPAGLALGLRNQDDFSKYIQEQKLFLKKNDWFILYTDGINETMNGRLEDFGEKRLIKFIQNNHETEAENLIEIMYKEIENFAGLNNKSNNRQSGNFDDMTVIALRKTE